MERILTITGWIIGLISLVFAIKTHKRKKVSILVTEHKSTFVFTEDIEKDTEILYKGEKVKKIDRLEFIIQNEGNESIDGSEISSPIVFSVSETGKILTHNIVTQSKSHIEAVAELLNNQEISLSFTLLAPNDVIRCMMLISNFDDKSLKVRGRIVGIPRFDGTIRTTKPPLELFRSKLVSSIFWILFSIVSFLLANIQFETTLGMLNIFPKRDWDTFRIFKIAIKDSSTTETKIGLPVTLTTHEFRDIPPMIDLLAINANNDSARAHIDSLKVRFRKKFQRFSILDQIVSTMNISEIIEKYGQPNSVVSAILDSSGRHYLKMETWKYNSKNPIEIMRDYFDRIDIVFITVSCLTGALSILIVILNFRSISRCYRILNKQERQKLLYSILLRQQLKT